MRQQRATQSNAQPRALAFPASVPVLSTRSSLGRSRGGHGGSPGSWPRTARSRGGRRAARSAALCSPLVGGYESKWSCLHY